MVTYRPWLIAGPGELICMYMPVHVAWAIRCIFMGYYSGHISQLQKHLLKLYCLEKKMNTKFRLGFFFFCYAFGVLCLVKVLTYMINLFTLFLSFETRDCYLQIHSTTLYTCRI